MTEEIDILAIEDAGTIQLTGRDVLVIGILSESYQRIVDAGLVDHNEWFFGITNDFLEKVGNASESALGSNPFPPVEDVTV
jgi:hypothetical protein